MEACNGPLTMLMGYSERQDRVIVYDFHLNPATQWEPTGPRQWMYRVTFRKPVEKVAAAPARLPRSEREKCREVSAV